jgi:hypothetical protein
MSQYQSRLRSAWRTSLRDQSTILRRRLTDCKGSVPLQCTGSVRTVWSAAESGRGLPGPLPDGEGLGYLVFAVPVGAEDLVDSRTPPRASALYSAG